MLKAMRERRSVRRALRNLSSNSRCSPHFTSPSSRTTGRATNRSPRFQTVGSERGPPSKPGRPAAIAEGRAGCRVGDRVQADVAARIATSAPYGVRAEEIFDHQPQRPTNTTTADGEQAGRGDLHRAAHPLLRLDVVDASAIRSELAAPRRESPPAPRDKLGIRAPAPREGPAMAPRCSGRSVSARARAASARPRPIEVPAHRVQLSQLLSRIGARAAREQRPIRTRLGAELRQRQQGQLPVSDRAYPSCSSKGAACLSSSGPRLECVIARFVEQPPPLREAAGERLERHSRRSGSGHHRREGFSASCRRTSRAPGVEPTAKCPAACRSQREAGARMRPSM